MRIRDWSAYVSSSDLLSGDQVDHRSAAIRLSHHKGETRQTRAPSLSRSRRLARDSHFAVHGRLRQGRDYKLLDIAAEGAVARLGAAGAGFRFARVGLDGGVADTAARALGGGGARVG